MKYQVRGFTDEDNQIHVITELETSMSKMMQELSHRVYNIQSEVLKSQLIQLGWTPPQEPKKENEK